MKLLNLAGRFCIAVLAAAVFSFSVAAQTNNIENKATKIPVETDENFVLNITEERLTEIGYERSTAVEVRGADGLAVGAGAFVRAGTINILLRGITGNVSFRASLESIRQRVESLTERRPPTGSRQP